MSYFNILTAFFLLTLFSWHIASLKSPKNLASCSFPNGTDKALHVFNCDLEKNLPIKIMNARVINTDTNQTMYPIDPRKHIALEFTINNSGATFDDIKTNVTLGEYQNDWVSNTCKWTEVPTFGLLNNMDACNMAHNCPLGPGTNQTFQLKLDLSSFAAIINLLANDIPYQINIPMYDFNSNSNHEEILCAVAQVMFEETN